MTSVLHQKKKGQVRSEAAYQSPLQQPKHLSNNQQNLELCGIVQPIWIMIM